MLTIVVLEDNQIQLEAITNFIQRYTTFENLDTSIGLATSDPDIILDYVKKNAKSNFLFFLDIELEIGDINGIEVASKIRQMMPFAQIVFITSHEELSLLTIKRRIAPMDYILKNTDIQSVQESIRADILNSLDLCINKKESNPDIFIYKQRSRYFEISMNSLFFLSSVPNMVNHVIVHSNNRVTEIHDSLSNLENKYPTLFRCHKGFLINVSTVSSFDTITNKIYFNNSSDLWCPVSSRKKSAFRRLLKAYTEKNNVN